MSGAATITRQEEGGPRTLEKMMSLSRSAFFLMLASCSLVTLPALSRIPHEG